MENQTIKKQIENYSLELKSELHHSLLKRDLGEVAVKKSAAFFLLLPLLNGEKWSKCINTAAIAVGAVHAAFDAHDEIDGSDATTMTQQLIVLAGDHYSGIHYKLLASVPDIDFIAALSNVIGKINETKTNLYYQSKVHSSELIDAIQVIEVGCINEFFNTFGFSNYIPLVSSAYPLLILDALKQNDVQCKTHIAYEWDVHNHDLSEAITQLRAETLRAIEGADFLSSVLKEEIFKMTAPLLGKTI